MSAGASGIRAFGPSSWKAQFSLGAQGSMHGPLVPATAWGLSPCGHLSPCCFCFTSLTSSAHRRRARKRLPGRHWVFGFSSSGPIGWTATGWRVPLTLPSSPSALFPSTLLPVRQGRNFRRAERQLLSKISPRVERLGGMRTPIRGRGRDWKCSDHQSLPLFSCYCPCPPR